MMPLIGESLDLMLNVYCISLHKVKLIFTFLFKMRKKKKTGKGYVLVITSCESEVSHSNTHGGVPRHAATSIKACGRVHIFVAYGI